MKKAFTLLEIVFVVTIIAILSITTFSLYENDDLTIAKEQVLEHIRYTRYLAMSESKFDPIESFYLNQTGSGQSGMGKYQLSFWQIRFIKRLSTNPQVIGYSIYSDRDRKGNIDTVSHIEPAVNQYDRKLIHAFGDPDSQKVSVDSFLNLRYGIVDVYFSTSCQPAGYSRVSNDIGTIVFDNNGVPYSGVSNVRSTEFMLKNDCNITLVHKSGKKAIVTVSKGTGYVFASP